MRPLRTSVAIVALSLFTYQEAAAQSTSLNTETLFAYCTSKNQTANTMCALYMAGFMHGVTTEQLIRGDGPQKLCLPQGLTGNQVKDIFEGFTRDYPKAGFDHPGLVIHLALFRAFPCPGAMNK